MKLAKNESREGGGGRVSSSNPNFALFCLLPQLAKLGEEGVGKERRNEVFAPSVPGLSR